MKTVNKVNKDRQDNNVGASVVFTRLSNSLENGKRRLANFLSQQAERLSERNKMLALLLFGLFMSAASAYVIIYPYRNQYTSVSFKSAGTISIPSAPQYQEKLISEEEYLIMRSYKKTLDSLAKYDPGTYYVLMKNRSGLMDSLNFLIKLYDNQ